MPDITYDVGRVSFVMKGAWNLATNYEKLDAVSYNGSLYIAKQDVPGGTAITNTTYWQLAAEKGDKGDTGGVDSVNGQQGDVWFPDSRQLISDGYATDTDPFLMKGNDSDSDRFELAKKLGNTVAVNQGARELNSTNYYTSGGTASYADGVATFTASTQYGQLYQTYDLPRYDVISGHKYLIMGTLKLTSGTTAVLFQFRKGDDSGNIVSIATESNTSPQSLRNVFTATASTTAYIRVIDTRSGGWDAITISGVYIIDLTLWFGSNDRIPSDLLAHPENWGRYYAGSLAYNAGTLGSADGSVLKSIGRQVWDEEWEVGGINLSTGQNASANNKIRSTNYVPVMPNTAYYAKAKLTNGVLFYGADKTYLGIDYAAYPNNSTFTTPPNAYYMRFVVSDTYGTTYNHDLTISLYYSGESGYDQYYPYTVLAEVDTGGEPLYGDGTEENSDVKLPSGEITRKRDRVDMGTLTYQLNTGLTGVDRFRVINYAPIKSCNASNTPSLKCVKFVASDMVTANAQFAVWVVGQDLKDIYFYTPAGTYASADAFKTAMSGIYLDFPLATPTTEQGTAFAPIVATVKNGVLSWTNTKGIPVGHESHYFENLRKRVEDRLPDPPGADGTYRLTCTISGGVKTYSWEA